MLRSITLPTLLISIPSFVAPSYTNVSQKQLELIGGSLKQTLQKLLSWLFAQELPVELMFQTSVLKRIYLERFPIRLSGSPSMNNFKFNAFLKIPVNGSSACYIFGNKNWQCHHATYIHKMFARRLSRHLKCRKCKLLVFWLWFVWCTRKKR